MRTPGKGEEMIDAFDRDGFTAMMRSQSAGFDDKAIAHYWRAFETEDGRRGVLELYRSGDFPKLEPYRGKLAALGLPTLLLWGADDPFAPVAGAYRFKKEIPGAEMVVVEGAGHFVFADDPQRCAREVAGFLTRYADGQRGPERSSDRPAVLDLRVVPEAVKPPHGHARAQFDQRVEHRERRHGVLCGPSEAEATGPTADRAMPAPREPDPLRGSRSVVAETSASSVADERH